MLLHAVGQGVRLVDFVYRNDDRNFGGVGVIDGFERLRHHAVIGGDHQHDDVRGLGSARTHAGESFVTRRIQEHDLAAECGRFFIGDLYFVSADVLRDATGFAAGHIRDSNGIEQRGFTVIDVAHDGNHRRTDAGLRNELLRRQRPHRSLSPSALRSVMTFVSAPKKRAISLASSASSVWLIVANTPLRQQAARSDPWREFPASPPGPSR